MEYLDEVKFNLPYTYIYKEKEDIENYDLLIFYHTITKIITLYDKGFINFYNNNRLVDLDIILDSYITQNIKVDENIFNKYKNDDGYIYFYELLYYVLNFYFDDKNKKNNYEFEFNLFEMKLKTKYCRKNGLDYFYYSKYG